MRTLNQDFTRGAVLAGVATATGTIGAAIGTIPLWLGLYAFGRLAFLFGLVGALAGALPLHDRDGHREQVCFTGVFAAVGFLVALFGLPIAFIGAGSPATALFGGLVVGALIAFTAPLVARSSRGLQLLQTAPYAALLERLPALAEVHASAGLAPLGEHELKIVDPPADTSRLTHWLEWARSEYPNDDAVQLKAGAGAMAAEALGVGAEQAMSAGRSAAEVRLDLIPEEIDIAVTVESLLTAGWTPGHLPESSVPLNRGERLIAQSQCDAWVWQAVTPKKGGGAWVGGLGPIGLMLLLISLVANIALAAKHRQEAQPKWLPMGRSVICLTDSRVLRGTGNSVWNTYPLTTVRSIQLSSDHMGIALTLAGKEATPFQYRLSGAEVWAVLIKHLAPQAHSAAAGVASTGVA